MIALGVRLAIQFRKPASVSAGLLACLLATAAVAQPAIPLPPAPARAPAQDPTLARPRVGPPPAWVQQAPTPPAAPDAASAAIALHLFDQQVLLEPDTRTTYLASALTIGSAQALQAAALGLGWDPALETLTIHHFRLVRDGKPIDLLKDGSPIVVLRREPNLEQAAIDGRLTATLQPDDVRVGDRVELAYTLARKDPATAGRADHVAIVPPRIPIGRARIRILAPADMALASRTWPGLPPLKASRAGNRQQLLFDATNHVAPEPPRGAPTRYLLVNGLEVSNAAGWGDIATTFAGQYAEAAKLAPDSPLKAEAARIRAQSKDPLVQAGLALALVQNQVRYLLLALDGGGYRPMPADTSWARRLGDCKAKTVLLIALLNELGIEARPLLVNSRIGDSLAEALPRVTAFDHVLVEATIAGKRYWLDGTEAGETRLDRLRPPPFRWGLPLADGVTALEPIPTATLAGPDLRQRLDIDARAGLIAPAPAEGEMRFSGPAASTWRLALGQMTAADRQKALRTLWEKEHDFVTPETVEAREDPATGDQILTMKGKARMDWGNDIPAWYLADGSRFGFEIDVRREPGPFVDAPFAFDHPEWIARSQTILLPGGGKGFSLHGKDFDRTVGIHAFARKATLMGERFHFDGSTRSLAPEIAAAQARAAEADYRLLANERLNLRAPPGYVPTRADVAALIAETPGTVEALLLRASLFENAGEYRRAIADGEAALKLQPDRAETLGRLAAWVKYTDPKRSLALAEQALKIDPKQWNALAARADFAMQQNRPADAEKDYAAAAAAQPGWSYPLEGRANALARLGRRDEAAALARQAAKAIGSPDVEAMVEAGIADSSPEGMRRQIETALKADPNNPRLLHARARLRNSAGDKPGAIADFEAAIAAPSANDEYRGSLYLELAQARPPARRDLWSADLDKSRTLDPDNAARVELARSVIERRAGNTDAAVRALDAAVALDPDDTDLALMRIEQLKALDRLTPAQAVDAIAAVAARHPDNPNNWNHLCWEKATMQVQLDTALADCERGKAVGRNPGLSRQPRLSLLPARPPARGAGRLRHRPRAHAHGRVPLRPRSGPAGDGEQHRGRRGFRRSPPPGARCRQGVRGLWPEGAGPAPGPGNPGPCNPGPSNPGPANPGPANPGARGRLTGQAGSASTGSGNSRFVSPERRKWMWVTSARKAISHVHSPNSLSLRARLGTCDR